MPVRRCVRACCTASSRAGPRIAAAMIASGSTWPRTHSQAVPRARRGWRGTRTCLRCARTAGSDSRSELDSGRARLAATGSALIETDHGDQRRRCRRSRARCPTCSRRAGRPCSSANGTRRQAACMRDRSRASDPWLLDCRHRVRPGFALENAHAKHSGRAHAARSEFSCKDRKNLRSLRARLSHIAPRQF